MKNNRSTKKIQLTLWGKIVFCIIVISLSLFLLTSSINILKESISKTKTQEEILVTYETKNTISKEVFPVENEFYTKEDINSTKSYVSKYLDYINFNLNYMISSKLNLDGLIESNVEVYLKSYKEGTNEEIYSKKLENSDFLTKDFYGETTLEDNREVQINFKELNEEAKAYQDSLEFPVDSYVTIYYKTNIEGNYIAASTISEKNEVVIKMPLNKDTTEVIEEIPRNKNINVYKEVTLESKTNPTGIVISALLIISAVYLIVVFYHHLIMATKEEDYFALLKKYFKKYEEVIVRVHNIPNEQDLKIIKVKTFEDLIDLQVEFRIPILYYETKKNYISKFVIIKGIYMYQYILNRKSNKTTTK